MGGRGLSDLPGGGFDMDVLRELSSTFVFAWKIEGDQLLATRLERGPR